MTVQLPSEMLEAQVQPDSTVKLTHVPLPSLPTPHSLLIKIIYTGVNPKDWKMPAGRLQSIFATPNSGDDMLGEVVQVGSDVFEFQTGDLVAGLHRLGEKGGSFAEYGILEDFSAFKVDGVRDGVWAGVPMVGYMAVIALFGLLQVTPGPWSPLPDNERRPLIIYGAASGVGHMAVKIALLTNIHPLICVAGSGASDVQSLLDESKGDRVINYKNGDAAVVQGFKDALKPGEKLEYAFDAITEHGSWRNICDVLDHQSGRICTVLPPKPKDIPDGIIYTCCMAGSLWCDLAEKRARERPDLDPNIGNLGLERGGQMFGAVYGRWFARALKEGLLKTHKTEVVPGGLGGLEEVLKSIRGGKSKSTTKYVFKIAETEGISS